MSSEEKLSLNQRIIQGASIDTPRNITIHDVGIDLEKMKVKPVEKMITCPATGREILNKNAQEIIEDILNGMSMRKIAKKYGVGVATFFMWRRDSEYSAIIEVALTESAEYFVEKAEEVLLQVAGEKEMADVQRRRSLSDFYKWMASKKMPRVYGKQDNNTNVTVNVETPDNKQEFVHLLQAVKKKSQIEAAKSDKGTEDAEIVPDSE